MPAPFSRQTGGWRDRFLPPTSCVNLNRDLPVSRLPVVTVTVYPYECDPFGHLNEAAFLQLFERARWEMLAQGLGVDLFQRNGVWPAVRKATVEYLRPALPGDRLEVQTDLLKLGHTSMELRQRAIRVGEQLPVAEADLVFVMIDRSGNPTAIPEEVAAMFGPRVSTRAGDVVRYDVGEVTLAADVRGDGPTLLMVHGFPLDRSIWKHQVATLAGWRRIAPDLRGFGGSDVPAAGYSMAAYADDLVRLLDRMRAARAVVAGLSMGGYVVFELLRRYRERIAGVILLDTKAEADTADARRGRDEMAALVREKGAAAVAERMLPKVLGRSTLQTQLPLVEQVREMMARQPVPGIVGALEAMRDREDATALLPTIDVPTLVVVGQEDDLTPPPLARAMAAAIPSASITAIPGAGHITPLESPTAVSRLFAEFLEGVRES